MPTAPRLGIIADDYTGATDVAGMIARAGMSVVQHLGVPAADPQAGIDSDRDERDERDADCIVIALKTRSIPASEAVAQSIAAARWLLGQGVRQLYFKYCSTFDSTDAGNIGPVADALAEEVGAEGAVVFCPATPEHGRTTYLGHHFVHDALLSDSPMRDHPLTPMRDPDLRRVLARQTATPVGLLALSTIRRSDARAELTASASRAFVIADATSDEDIAAVAEAVADAPLVTGGAALAAALARREAGGTSPRAPIRPPAGDALVVAGSSSAATRRQIGALGEGHPVFRVDALALDRGDDVGGEALRFLEAHRSELPVIAATDEPDRVSAVQHELGVERSAALIEEALSDIAARAVGAGFTRVLVAGGETSGAVVNGLGVTRLRIGEEVAAGVPWTVATATPGGQEVGLLLKSGNLGGDDVFRRAIDAADRA